MVTPTVVTSNGVLRLQNVDEPSIILRRESSNAALVFQDPSCNIDWQLTSTSNALSLGDIATLNKNAGIDIKGNLHLTNNLRVDGYSCNLGNGTYVTGPEAAGSLRMLDGSSDWAVYHSASNSLAGGSAPPGYDFSNAAMRLRVPAASDQGLIFENAAEKTLVSLNGSTGKFAVCNDLRAGGDVSFQDQRVFTDDVGHLNVRAPAPHLALTTTSNANAPDNAALTIHNADGTFNWSMHRVPFGADPDQSRLVFSGGKSYSTLANMSNVLTLESARIEAEPDTILKSNLEVQGFTSNSGGGFYALGAGPRGALRTRGIDESQYMIYQSTGPQGDTAFDTPGETMHFRMPYDTSNGFRFENADGIPLMVLNAGTADLAVLRQVLSGTSGSSMPGFSFAEDQSIGIHKPSGEKAVAITTSNSRDAVYVDAANRVGVNLADPPSHQLHVGGDARIESNLQVRDDLSAARNSFDVGKDGASTTVAQLSNTRPQLVLMGTASNDDSAAFLMRNAHDGAWNWAARRRYDPTIETVGESRLVFSGGASDSNSYKDLPDILTLSHLGAGINTSNPGDRALYVAGARPVQIDPETTFTSNVHFDQTLYLDGEISNGIVPREASGVWIDALRGNVRFKPTAADTDAWNVFGSNAILSVTKGGVIETQHATLEDTNGNAVHSNYFARDRFGFDSHRDTGLRNAGAQKLALQTSNTDVLTIDDQQRTGINITAPQYPLHVSGKTHLQDGGLSVAGAIDQNSNYVTNLGNTFVHSNLTVDETLHIGRDAGWLVQASNYLASQFRRTFGPASTYSNAELFVSSWNRAPDAHLDYVYHIDAGPTHGARHGLLQVVEVEGETCLQDTVLGHKGTSLPLEWYVWQDTSNASLSLYASNLPSEEVTVRGYAVQAGETHVVFPVTEDTGTEVRSTNGGPAPLDSGTWTLGVRTIRAHDFKSNDARLGLNTHLPGESLHVVAGNARADRFFASSNGTSNAPALAWADDRDTGLYLKGADQLALATGGTERTTVDASGKMIHRGELKVDQTVTLESNLDLTHTSGTNAIQLISASNSNEAGRIRYHDVFSNYPEGGGSLVLSVGSSEDLGTFALPSNNLILAPKGIVYIDNAHNSNSASMRVLGSLSTGSIDSSNNYITRNFFDDGTGRVGIGTLPDYHLHVDGETYAWNYHLIDSQGDVYVLSQSEKRPTGLSLGPVNSNPSAGATLFSIDSTGDNHTRLGVTNSNGVWVRDGLRVGYAYDGSDEPTSLSDYSLDVNGDIRATSNVQADGNLEVKGTTYLSNALTLDSDLNVNGSLVQLSNTPLEIYGSSGTQSAILGIDSHDSNDNLQTWSAKSLYGSNLYGFQTLFMVENVGAHVMRTGFTANAGSNVASLDFRTAADDVNTSLAALCDRFYVSSNLIVPEALNIGNNTLPRAGLDVSTSSILTVMGQNEDAQNRGLYMWRNNDGNWVIYMASSTNGTSPGGSAPVAGHDFTEDAIRFRAAKGSDQGFIFENGSDERILSINAGTHALDLNGDARFRGSQVHIDGQLGLGTTNPSYKLHMIGDAYIDGALTVTQGATFSDRVYLADGTAAAPALTWTNDSNTGWFRPSADEIALTTGGTERMRLTTQGDLGINVAAPQSRLHVGGDARVDKDLHLTSNLASVYASNLVLDAASLKATGGAHFYEDSGDGWIARSPDGGQFSLKYFQNTGSDKDSIEFYLLRWTDSQTHDFEILYELRLRQSNQAVHRRGKLRIVSTDIYVRDSPVITIHDTVLDERGVDNNFNRFDWLVRFNSSSTSEACLSLYTEAAHSYNVELKLFGLVDGFTDDITFWPKTTDTDSIVRFNAAPTPRDPNITDWTYAARYLYAQNMAGRIGIGTDYPGTKLAVDGDISTTSRLMTADGTAGAPALTFSGDQDTGIFRAGGDELALATGGNERLRMDASGRLGLNTTTPSARLHVMEQGSGAGTQAPIGNIHLSHPDDYGYNAITFMSKNMSGGGDGGGVFFFDNLPQYGSIFNTSGSSGENAALALTTTNDILGNGSDDLLLHPAGAVFIDGGTGSVPSPSNNPNNNAHVYVLGEMRSGAINWDGSTSTFTERNVFDDGGGRASFSNDVTMNALLTVDNIQTKSNVPYVQEVTDYVTTGAWTNKSPPLGQNPEWLLLGKVDNKNAVLTGTLYGEVADSTHGTNFSGSAHGGHIVQLTCGTDGTNVFGGFTEQATYRPQGSRLPDIQLHHVSYSGQPYLALRIDPDMYEDTPKSWTFSGLRALSFKNGKFLEYVSGADITPVARVDGNAPEQLASISMGLKLRQGDLTVQNGNINVSNTALLSDGSASAPSFAFSQDGDTGVFRPASDQLGLSTGGNERVRIAANGRMAVGHSSPISSLDAIGAIVCNPEEITFDGGGGAGMVTRNVGLLFNNNRSWSLIPTGDDLEFHHGGGGSYSLAMAFRHGGNTMEAGHFEGSYGSASRPTYGWNGDNDTGMYRAAVDTVALATGGAERMRIDSAGNMGINITSPSARLHVGGDILATGEVTANSDARLKTDIRTIEGATDRLRRLRGYTYRRTEEKEKREVGLLAQEVLEVLPEAVRTDPATGLHSLAYGNLVGFLVEAMREMDQRLENQAQEITRLKEAIKI